MPRTRNRKKEDAAPVRAPRKRRRRRTRAQIAADLATARNAIEVVMADDEQADYDNIAARVRVIEQDVKGRLSTLTERYMRDGAEIGNLQGLVIGVEPSTVSVSNASAGSTPTFRFANIQG